MTTDEMIDNYQKRVGIGDGFTRFGVRELMKAYARSKCAEQRKIIAGGLPDRCFVDIDESWITSMNEPEME